MSAMNNFDSSFLNGSVYMPSMYLLDKFQAQEMMGWIGVFLAWIALPNLRA